MDNKLTRYAELKLEIKYLEEEAEKLKKEIMPEVERLGGVEIPLGKFSIKSLNRWKYTKAVTELEEKVKIKKTEEEEKGIATLTTSNSLVFTSAKI